MPTTALDDEHHLSRRGLLRMLGLGGATVLVAGTGALSYRVYDTAVLDPGGGPAFEPWTRWRELPGPLGAVACAVLAASPHNTQPWAFALGAGSIDVFVDSLRGTGVVDPLRREQFIGLGCAVENLVLGARARGLAPEVSWLPDGDDSERVARITLASAEPRVRRAVRRDRQPAHQPRALHRASRAARVPGGARRTRLGWTTSRVHWVHDPAPKAALSRLLVDAAEALTHDEQQSRDGFVWFRDSQRRHPAAPRRTGARRAGTEPLVLAIAKLLPASSRTDGRPVLGQPRPARCIPPLQRRTA